MKVNQSDNNLTHLINDSQSMASNLQYEISEIETNISRKKIQLASLVREHELLSKQIYELDAEFKKLKEQKNALLKSRYDYINELPILKLENAMFYSARSNLTAIPYMAAILADFETRVFEVMAKQLDWGKSVQREKKVKDIREIRADARAIAERNLDAKYQLNYLLQLFPNLQDVIETDYKDLPIIDTTQITAYDRTRDWLSKEEYQSLSSVERNQLALDRYKESHNKTKWQIGRDYELYVGYRYTLKGYSVDYYGSYMGMEDLGRDLIAKKDDTILIVQCKYWSQIKTIHEKHINQLYGTMICYCIEHDLSPDQVKGVLVTNITLSDTAKKMAQYLRIECVENFERGDYPCIKCNIGHGEHGTEKIYHLPFDQQYDATKINAPGEFYAMTVKEAEEAGFRRAFKWFAGD